jgi:hypothetical protein
MGLNLKNQGVVEKLHDMVLKSYVDLDHYRGNRTALLRKFVGEKYAADRGPEQATVVNLMAQMVEAYGHRLAANNPRVTVETEFTAIKPFARRFGLALNRLIEDLDLQKTLQAIVVDALFQVGIAKIHNGRSDQMDFGEYGKVDPGKPCVQRISLDDFFYDTSARTWEESAFCGNFYRVRLANLVEDPNIDDAVKEKIKATREARVEREGTDLASDIGQAGSQDETLYPMVELMDVWLPLDRVVVTLLRDDKTSAPVRTVKWGGVKDGPYRMLAFVDVPDNVIPLSTMGQVAKLHDLYNHQWKKLADQAERQKQVNLFRGGLQEEADRVKGAVDGEWINCNDPNGFATWTHPGPDQGLIAFSINTLQMFDRSAGNLAAMAGLGPQADTLGQEQIIHAQQGAMEQKRQQTVLRFAAYVLRDLGFLLWNDQFTSMDNFYSLPGGQFKVPYSWRPGEREGQFDQYTFQVEPYSMMYSPPAAKVQTINELLVNVYGALLPLSVQAGGGPLDLQELLEIHAEYLNLPRLKNLIKFGAVSPSDPNQFTGDMLQHQSAKPPGGKRTYERISRSAGKPENTMLQMMQIASKNQPQQGGNAA